MVNTQRHIITVYQKLKRAQNTSWGTPLDKNPGLEVAPQTHKYFFLSLK